MPFQHCPAHKHGVNGILGAGREIFHHPVVADDQRETSRSRERADQVVQAGPAHHSCGPCFYPASNHANTPFGSMRRTILRAPRSTSTDDRKIQPRGRGGYTSNLLNSRLSQLQCDL